MKLKDYHAKLKCSKFTWCSTKVRCAKLKLPQIHFMQYKLINSADSAAQSVSTNRL